VDMTQSLRYVDPISQRCVDDRPSARLLWGMAHPEEERKALGRRLKSARTLAELTLDQAAAQLTDLGYPIIKQTISAWETGRNLPDALWLKRLAKLYGTTLDALVWDDSLTIEAIQLAAQFDSLNEEKQRTLRVLWQAYVADAAMGGEALPPAPSTPPGPTYNDMVTKPAIPQKVDRQKKTGS
jgi:transcriptional regulator with XRE-family HTH domain